MVLELDILDQELVEVRIRKLAMGVHDPPTEIAGVQLDLNLQIIDLQLKAQPLNPQN